MKLKSFLKTMIDKDYPVVITVGNLIVYKGPIQLDIAKYAINKYLNKRVLAYSWDTKYTYIYCKGGLYVKGE